MDKDNEMKCRLCGLQFIETQIGLAELTFHEILHGEDINEHSD